MKRSIVEKKCFSIFAVLFLVNLLFCYQPILADEQDLFLDEVNPETKKILGHLDSAQDYQQVLRFSDPALDEVLQLDFVDGKNNLLFFKLLSSGVFVCHCDNSSLSMSSDNLNSANFESDCAHIEDVRALEFLKKQARVQNVHSQNLLSTLELMEIKLQDLNRKRSFSSSEVIGFSPNIEYRNLFYIGQELGHVRGQYHQFRYKGLNMVVIVPTDAKDLLQIAWTDRDIKPAVFRSKEFSNLFYRPLSRIESIGISHFFDSLHIFASKTYSQKMSMFIEVLEKNSSE